MLSKCVHITGVGLVSRPWTNVSLASKKLKSSGTKGNGDVGIAEAAPRGSKITARPAPGDSPSLVFSELREPSLHPPKKSRANLVGHTKASSKTATSSSRRIRVPE